MICFQSCNSSESGSSYQCSKFCFDHLKGMFLANAECESIILFSDHQWRQCPRSSKGNGRILYKEWDCYRDKGCLDSQWNHHLEGVTFHAKHRVLSLCFGVQQKLTIITLGFHPWLCCTTTNGITTRFTCSVVGIGILALCSKVGFDAIKFVYKWPCQIKILSLYMSTTFVLYVVEDVFAACQT